MKVSITFTPDAGEPITREIEVEPEGKHKRSRLGLETTPKMATYAAINELFTTYSDEFFPE